MIDKTCSKCHLEKHLVDFHKDKSSKDGICNTCKKCKIAEYMRAYRIENKTKIAEQKRDYQQKNTDKTAERNRKYQKNNSEKISQRKRKYRIDNSAKISSDQSKYHARYYEKNSELIKSKVRDYGKKNPEKIRANYANRRTRERIACGKHTGEDIKQLLVLQRRKCACCKSSIKEIYHVDHVIPLARGGSNFKQNLQLLCPSCNQKKSAKHPIDFMQSKGYLL